MKTSVQSQISIKCPLCGLTQKQDPVKKWAYGKIIKKRSTDGTQWGAAIHCSRYCCNKCEKFLSDEKNQLVLVNNGSSDNTEKEIDKYSKISNLKKVNVSKNQGFGYARLSKCPK